MLTDKSVYRDQTLADRIDREEKTFERDGAEQSWTLRGNKALSRDFIASQNQPCFGYGPDSLLSARDDDALRAGGLQLKPFRQRSRHHAQRSAGVHKKIDFFNEPRWTGQTALYVEQSHIKSLQKNRIIVARAINNATSLPRGKTIAKPTDLPVGAADETRIGDQPEDSQADRTNHSTQCTGQSRSSYPLIKQSKAKIENFKLLDDFAERAGAGG